METLDSIFNRRSVRRYLDRPVEFEKVTTIIDAARHAPSAGNLQGWKFIIVTEKNLIKQIADYSVEQYWIQTAPVIIVVCAIPEKHEMYYGLRGKRLYNIQDCAAAIQNILLTATDMGLGSCWIGAFEEDKLRGILEIPTDVRPQAIVTVGYADESPSERSLVPIEAVTYFNRYNMRIEKLHIVLRDYSEEWRRQGRNIRERLDKYWKKISQKFDEASKKIKEKNKEK